MTTSVTINDITSYANLTVGCNNLSTKPPLLTSTPLNVFNYFPTSIELPNVSAINRTNNSSIIAEFSTPSLNWSVDQVSYTGYAPTGATGSVQTITQNPGSVLTNVVLTGPDSALTVPASQNQTNVILSGLSLRGTAGAATGPTGNYTQTVTLDLNLTYGLRFTDPVSCAPQLGSIEPSLLQIPNVFYYQTTTPYTPVTFDGTVPIYLYISFTDGTTTTNDIIKVPRTSVTITNIPSTDLSFLTIKMDTQNILTSPTVPLKTTANGIKADITLLTSFYPLFGYSFALENRYL